MKSCFKSLRQSYESQTIFGHFATKVEIGRGGQRNSFAVLFDNMPSTSMTAKKNKKEQIGSSSEEADSLINLLGKEEAQFNCRHEEYFNNQSEDEQNCLRFS